ncbi:hypothetical protein D3C80_1613960 [compost metagenome]
MEQQGQAQPTVRLQQRRQRRADRPPGKPHRSGDAQLTHRRIAQLGQALLGLLGQRQYLGTAPIEGGAGLGQGQLAGGAVQQADLGAVLQLANLLADRRGRHAQHLGSRDHGAAIDHGGEDRHALELLH